MDTRNQRRALVEKEPGNLHDSFAVSAWINIEFASSCFLGLSSAHLTAFSLKVKSYDAVVAPATPKTS